MTVQGREPGKVALPLIEKLFPRQAENKIVVSSFGFASLPKNIDILRFFMNINLICIINLIINLTITLIFFFVFKIVFLFFFFTQSNLFRLSYTYSIVVTADTAAVRTTLGSSSRDGGARFAWFQVRMMHGTSVIASADDAWSRCMQQRAWPREWPADHCRRPGVCMGETRFIKWDKLPTRDELASCDFNIELIMSK